MCAQAAGRCGQSDSDHTVCDADVSQGNIGRKGAHVWYSFAVQSPGQEFQFDVELGTLTDSVMDLVDTDRETVLVENDDSGDTLASHIEWTAPAAGTYFIMVKAYGSETGTFLSLTAGSAPVQALPVTPAPALSHFMGVAPSATCPTATIRTPERATGRSPARQRPRPSLSQAGYRS